MSRWKALVFEMGHDEAVWYADVTADTEEEALSAALEIFLNTEDVKGVRFDFTTATVVKEANRGIVLKPLEICEAASN